MNLASGGLGDAAEISKFDALAHGFWDRDGAFKTLHDIDPVRLNYISERTVLRNMKLADIGCGGGLLAEGLAQRGAQVTAIDLAASMLEVARLHAVQSGFNIDYRQQSVESLVAETSGRFDVVCCMEMIEHVPEPAALVGQLAKLLRPGGSLFLSTINRSAKAFATAIVAAEYVLGLVPRGTHEYARLVRPSELARFAREAGLLLCDISGMSYNPLTRGCALGVAPEVNYLAHFRRELTTT
jgi:2-polyprenyl-6-hydroxyphenyl methylase/3-demethylubiquinone-9 3-methyltransferase